MGFSQRDLEAQLAGLGVRAGETVLVHASFKSLVEVLGGARTVIDAFESVLGNKGTLMMPGFNLCSPDKSVRAERWDLANTPSTVGYLSEFLRQLPGTKRSDHYSHSFLARGGNADYLTGGHLFRAGDVSLWDREPWGKTFGTDSPLVRALELDAKVLLLGAGHKSLTYWHLVEVRDWNARLREEGEAPYRPIERPRAGPWWESQREVHFGQVGDASCQIFSAQALVDRASERLRIKPSDFYPQVVAG